MTAHLDLGAFLSTDPRDVGCGEAMELLHAYADLHGADPAGAARRYPGILAHLRACGPCSTDFEGLLAALAVAPALAEPQLRPKRSPEPSREPEPERSPEPSREPGPERGPGR